MYTLMSALDVHLDRGPVDHPKHLRSECVPGAERDRRRRRWFGGSNGPPDHEHKGTNPHGDQGTATHDRGPSWFPHRTTPCLTYG
jgi:hypothetical protein